MASIKNKDSRPARTRYWAEHHLERNKLRNIVKCNLVMIPGETVTIPRFQHIKDEAGNVKRIRAGSFVRPRTRAMTKAEASAMWHHVRTTRIKR